MASVVLQSHPSRHEADAHTDAPHHAQEPANWERTRLAEERLPSIRLNDGLFKGREIIRRDSRIDGGVCLGARGREAIVVDWRHEATPGTARSLAALYNEAVSRATDERGFHRSRALQAVYHTVNEHFLDRSVEGIERINRYLRVKADDKVHIDCFISARTGACRHIALVCAAILERMADEGLVRGHVSHDRNSIPGQGAHAWCRYTSSVGEVFILDPMQGFFGTLKESEEQGTWNYARPDEPARMEEKIQAA